MIKKIDVLNNGYVELVDILGNEKRILEVARISYGKSVGNNDENLIKRLLKNEHWSPFEQVSFTFKVKCPIFIARQWMRHRTGKYNEVSRRYTKKNWDYYIPTVDLISDKKIRDYIISIMETQTKEYNLLLEKGVKPEIARMIMGTGFNTEFYFTIDLRNLLHFLKLRKDNHAQYEMQEYANAIEIFVTENMPNVMKYWGTA
jgi:thymidylate synthase (FAD)